MAGPTKTPEHASAPTEEPATPLRELRAPELGPAEDALVESWLARRWIVIWHAGWEGRTRLTVRNGHQGQVVECDTPTDCVILMTEQISQGWLDTEPEEEPASPFVPGKSISEITAQLVEAACLAAMPKPEPQLIVHPDDGRPAEAHAFPGTMEHVRYLEGQGWRITMHQRPRNQGWMVEAAGRGGFDAVSVDDHTLHGAVIKLAERLREDEPDDSAADKPELPGMLWVMLEVWREYGWEVRWRYNLEADTWTLRAEYGQHRVEVTDALPAKAALAADPQVRTIWQRLESDSEQVFSEELRGDDAPASWEVGPPRRFTPGELPPQLIDMDFREGVPWAEPGPEPPPTEISPEPWAQVEVYRVEGRTPGWLIRSQGSQGQGLLSAGAELDEALAAMGRTLERSWATMGGRYDE